MNKSITDMNRDQALKVLVLSTNGLEGAEFLLNTLSKFNINLKKDTQHQEVTIQLLTTKLIISDSGVIRKFSNGSPEPIYGLLDMIYYLTNQGFHLNQPYLGLRPGKSHIIGFHTKNRMDNFETYIISSNEDVIYKGPASNTSWIFNTYPENILKFRYLAPNMNYPRFQSYIDSEREFDDPRQALQSAIKKLGSPKYILVTKTKN